MPFDIKPIKAIIDSISMPGAPKGQRFFKAGKVTGLSGSSKGLFLAGLDRPFLFLSKRQDDAITIYHDCNFFRDILSKPHVYYLPEDGPDRIKVLYDLTAGCPDAPSIITTLDAASIPVWAWDCKKPSDDFIRLKKGESIDRDAMAETLVRLGYKRVSLVADVGEYSIRGWIFDIFNTIEGNPIRIELFGDVIESIKLFEIDSQRSFRELSEIVIAPAGQPDSGPNLIDLWKAEHQAVILDESSETPEGLNPSEMGSPKDQRFFGVQLLSLYSLRLEGDGYAADVMPLEGMGITCRERKGIEEFPQAVRDIIGRRFILLVSASRGQAERMRDLLFDADIVAPIIGPEDVLNFNGAIAITVSPLTRGLSMESLLVLTGKEIFGERPAQSLEKPGRIKRSKITGLIQDIDDLKEGDYVVHIEHGIGRFLGLIKQRVDSYEGEFLLLEYRGGDRLYVPLHNINRIQKYHAPEGVIPAVDRLGGKTWQRTKARVGKRIKEMAERLLRLYAERSIEEGYAFSADTQMHSEFDNFFSYEETPDQITAIHEIKDDMEQPRPMDRLLCGDVGYGKTEVAMRAAFKTVYDGKQVAVLVPTTILAEQHYETFRQRFSGFPVRIDYLSRFKSNVEQKDILKRLSRAEIDIVIGTHRLLAKDVSFNDLGLLIIDEEHRFGVAHKERIKDIKKRVDVLTMTATPIPRTLHMALSGLRGISVIETPPEDRLSVRSFVAPFSSELIREAINRELDRDGQVFFVHNRVRDIYSIATYLSGHIPQARIAVAHGQMPERELESAMRRFLYREADILLSTSIIGSGLDIPTANTIIIDRADRFGLADLYQLRGRVGRSDLRAYAYFLVPGDDITEEARKRLQAIQELNYLGAGFRLAMKDLEIRGAGNLLGPEQSGHAEAVGFDLYIEMLERAVAELRGEPISVEIDPVIDLKIDARIEESYIEDPNLRLSLYRRIANLKDEAGLAGLVSEMRDRFGEIPDETKRLVDIVSLKLMSKALRITAIRNNNGIVRITFADDNHVGLEKIYALSKRGIRLFPDGIEVALRGLDWQRLIYGLKNILQELL